ncbi:acetoacetate decarboxylase [Rivularia sp. PCC 7116]|uniref:acetoacetate decarboxylase family protein n=1 Tax=Rivularia sp. PCC 7116 TaxID=373994 RepID=UPI00029F1305|nr:acetoacetate decarboxylase family protein [Rivularia sp. PCC 7116]AFY58927.1 acetoacetate decarboxylase [Rivularia sp. PCC 7116]
MTYPAAPWHLKGYAVQTLQLVDIDKASKFIPSELEIVSLLPGKTLGSIYISCYESGSLLTYNELIAAPGLVRYQGKIGGWISHIYVDNLDSVAGGREIWGLPKEMADFSWNNGSVSVSQNNRELCSLSYQKSFLNLSTWWQQELSAGCFGGLGSELLFFDNNFKTQVALLQGKLEIPQYSPFASLNLDKPLFTLNLQKLELMAGVPKVVGEKAPELSYS